MAMHFLIKLFKKWEITTYLNLDEYILKSYNWRKFNIDNHK